MEILNSYVTQDVAWWGILLIFLSLNILSVGIAIMFDAEWYTGLIIGTICFMIIFGLMLVTGAFQQYTVCEVRIDDTVSFKDIYSSYEVISQRGNIYTLKELIK